MPFATASDGTRLAYEVTGDGPALLLVAGQSNDRHIWHPVRDALAASYRVVTFDHRGTGDSGKPDAPPYTTRGFATVRAEGTRRLYAVDPRPLADLDTWLDRFRRFWAPHLDALATEIARGKRARKQRPRTRTPAAARAPRTSSG